MTHVLRRPQAWLSELGVTASQDSRFGLGPGFLCWGTRDVPGGSSDGIFLSDFAE